MTPFYVCVMMACGARGLYFERNMCVEAATELSAFRELEWPMVRHRLQRQGLAYRVFVSPRAEPVPGRGGDVDPAVDRGAPRQFAAQPSREQLVVVWSR